MYMWVNFQVKRENCKDTYIAHMKVLYPGNY